MGAAGTVVLRAGRGPRGKTASPTRAKNSPRGGGGSASGAPAPAAPTAVTAARLEASSAPRFAGMNADAKLATRENVSTASAPAKDIETFAARMMIHASAAIEA